MFYYEILWAHEVSLMDPKIPNMENLHRIPARKGSAARLRAGQVLRVINTHVSQVVDFWAFNDSDLGECMSMEHTRRRRRAWGGGAGQRDPTRT